MDKGSAWQKFMITGSVKDYLNYKKYELLNYSDGDEEYDYGEFGDNDHRLDP